MSLRRVVVKCGTSTLTGGTKRLSSPRMVELCKQLAALLAAGHEVVLVTSGAVAAGREKLGLSQTPKTVAAKQMLAAVGQPRLMAAYEQIFSIYGLTIAQVLLTRADFDDRHHYLNSRNTFEALIESRVIPVVNENDTVATDEIRVGDNDNLSALVANLVDADLLVLLTDQAGLYTANPSSDPSAKLVERVLESEIPEALWKAAGGSSGNLGTGGMFTKLQAADLARRSGTAVVIASGTEPDVLPRLVSGEKIGTWFAPVATALESRKRYILSGGRAPGAVRINAGAENALRQGGSLLPVGATGVEGLFERGDTVRVVNDAGREIARGIANYGAVDLKKIAGKKSDEIEAVLGYVCGDEVVHRNDLVLI